MDSMAESSVGDISERERRRKQRERKKQANDAAQMNRSLEDPELANGNSEEILLEKVLTAQPLGGNSDKDLSAAETPSMSHGMDPMVIETLVGDNSKRGEKRIRKKESKRQAKRESDNIISAATPSEGHAKDPEVIESPVGDNSEKNGKRGRKKGRKKQAKKADHIIIQMDETLGDSNSKVADVNAESILPEKDLTAQVLGGNPEMDPVSVETLSAGHAMDSIVIESPVGDNSEKREKKRQKKEKRKQAKKADHIIIPMDETLDPMVIESPVGDNSEKHEKRRQKKEKKKQKADHIINQMDETLDPMVIESPVGENSEKLGKRRQKKEKKKQAKKADQTLEDSEVADANLEKVLLERDLASQPRDGIPNMDPASEETPSEGHAKKNNKATNEEEANGNLEKILPGKDLTTQTLFGNPKTNLGSEEVCSEDQVNKTREKNTEKETNEDEGQSKIDMGPSKNLVKGNITGKNERRQMKAAIEDESQNTHWAGSTEYAVEGNGTHEGKMKEGIKDVTTNVSSTDAKNVEVLCPLNAQITSMRRRKLLVLDLNGVLADIVRPPVPEEICGGTRFIFGQAIVKRPFYDDFLNFCFENFDVGIWSSRSRNKVPMIVDYLLGDLQSKLLFCWDMTHVTQTEFETIENRTKPLVLKELSKIWDNNNPRLGWRKGDYDKSNTLLLDDSPYKALLNPAHTAIFPNSYCYQQKDDNSLGPGGDLRVYLEGLLESENVQDYVERNPFGQSAITNQNPHWSFYEQVVKSVSEQSNKWSRNTGGRWNDFQSNRWSGNTRGRWNNFQSNRWSGNTRGRWNNVRR